jgi:hypothetical protein
MNLNDKLILKDLILDSKLTQTKIQINTTSEHLLQRKYKYSISIESLFGIDFKLIPTEVIEYINSSIFTQFIDDNLSDYAIINNNKLKREIINDSNIVEYVFSSIDCIFDDIISHINYKAVREKLMVIAFIKGVVYTKLLIKEMLQTRTISIITLNDYIESNIRQVVEFLTMDLIKHTVTKNDNLRNNIYTVNWLLVDNKQFGESNSKSTDIQMLVDRMWFTDPEAFNIEIQKLI